MVPSLPVRNLTSTAITIKRVERFQDPNTLQSKNTGYSFGLKDTRVISPTSPQLGEHAQSFKHQDLDITLAPFESYTLHQPGPEREGNTPVTSSTTIRLTIETPGGERYRIDANPSYSQKSSQPLTALSPDPSTSYTALFHPSKPVAHLTIHANHLPNYAKWMAKLPDSLPLSALSIPGTHNSHTHYRALPSARCQAVDIKTQLDNGIRFLDIRVQPVHAKDTSKKDLYLVHGAFAISLTGQKYFEPILQQCYDFLSANPTETILISLKREGVGFATDEHLARILDEHYIAPKASCWYTDSKLPYLGDVRGKLVLIRRYNTATTDTTAPGLDATAWPSNPTHALFPQPTSPSHQHTFCLQDFCEVLIPEAITQKVQYSNEHLVRAADCVHHIPGVNTDRLNPVPPGPLYLNYLSGSNFWKRACWPDQIASTVNRSMEEWICAGHHLVEPEVSPRHPDEMVVSGDVGEGVRRAKSGDGSTGVVVMDYVGDHGDWDLVRLVVGMNMGVLMKMQENEVGR
ncbi:PLC-like phosphodiesterase [Cucurbitaria berberidis CBS 394.84]|uniref:PLC-like phosphodiesterase n=1 Tax=Cucurbitaria berberidis CBS 394.84 TaxID=1168544 RepID=A0A9P4G907_9PLEO|nr:PLC-like phosphodiesterase [Cucurbitaria berberidis CBS 394.84]KAF1840924.1 PLC-like phosphodiesterase [Cucurbitaria berberidis CBS 394.84]